MIKEQVLTAVFSESMRDNLIDALIAMESLSGFSLGSIDGYSRAHSRYDLREQVSEYRRMCRVEVLRNEEEQQALLATLKKVTATGHLRY